MEPITREQWKAAFASVDHLRGAKLVVDTVRQFVEEQALPQGNLTIVQGAQILQQVLDYLVARNGARCSYNSRLRYRRILQTISNSLFQNGIISQPLLLEISPQYEREQVARIPALGQYQISDYSNFLTRLQRELAGFGKALIPKEFHDEVYCWLAVILAAWGICGSKPVSRLVLLEWGDVLFPPDHPVRWPNNQRHGYRWVYLPPICRLFFYGLFRQRRHGTSSLRIFPQDSKKLARSIRRFLDEKCKAYNLPVLTLELVGQLSRFEMLQDMSNHEVSVLTGRIRFSPLPADQIAKMLDDRRISIDPTRYSLVPSVSINPQMIHPSGMESPENLDALLQAYDYYFSEVRPLLLDLWHASSPKTNRQPLLEWIDKNMEEITDVAKFNVIWLLRWQLHLSSRKSFRLSSCQTYWIAALRVLHQFPGLRISDIGREELVSIFDEISDGDGEGSHHGYSSRRLSRAAWQSLYHFLQGENLALPTMDWKSMRIQRDYLPVRKITDENVRRLLEYLKGSPEQSLIWLARRAGLRVSEACNLWVDDVCLSRPAYLIIFKSKRQKDRKVDLSNMTERELAYLSSLVKRAHSASSQYLFFDSENKPFNPHQISKSTIRAFQKLGLRKNDTPGQEVSFHGLRSSAASFFQAEQKDIRYTALQLGHSWVTTTEGYLHDADLSANTTMQSRSNPWNTPQMCIPLSTIAFLLGVTDRRMVQIIGLPGGKAATNLFEEGKLFKENSPSDGPRPKRRGKPPYLISVAAATHILDQFHSVS